MSIWLVVGLMYWAGCLVLLLASMTLCDEHDQWQEMLRAVAKERFWQVLAGVSICLLFLAAIAPVATPYWLVQCHLQGRREREYMNHLKRTHREFIFEPVHPVNLPDATRSYFDGGSEELLRLGFSDLGSYRMKEDPADYYGRCYLSSDGTIVCTLIDIFDEQNYGLSTMFSDGRMLETSSSECTESMEWLIGNDRYEGVFATDEPIEEGLRMHRKAMVDVVQGETVRPLAFEPDVVLDFIQYEGRLFSQLQCERGELDAPPPTPQMPPHCIGRSDVIDEEPARPKSTVAESASNRALVLR